MFEILKALMALQHACAADDKYMHWEIDDSLVLRVEVQVTEADKQYNDNMRELLAPRED